MSSSDDSLLLHHHNLLSHMPHHLRREKLRFQPDAAVSFPIQPPQGGFSLTLSPTAVQPLGPFTGYAAVLSRSRFLRPAKQLLEEVCEVARGTESAGISPEVMSVDFEAGPAEQQWQKARLVSMIDEVCRRYRMYYQQVQNVITSFEIVAGLSSAAPYVAMALSSMSKSFKCLKSSMFNQLNCINSYSTKGGQMELSAFGVPPRQDGSKADAYRQQHAWRPQRGLPERSVVVLRAWLFEHFLHPYPTDLDKQMLAKQTGLTRNQVSNWFINARVRLWKPMVEEIHSLEMRHLHKTVGADQKAQMVYKQESQPSSSMAISSINQPPYIAQHIEGQAPYSGGYGDYNDLSGHDIGRSVGGVSLTLGLHHQNGGGVQLPESLPLNIARRFGLDDCGDAYVVGTFDGQDRCFGKGNGGGGHMLHDFVG